jgi:DNA-binding transcriptional LysR family regulator
MQRLSLRPTRKFIQGVQRMSHIEIRLFQSFVAVAEEQHFGRAALRLGITPPTLTQQIQKLERELGARFLERKGNRRVVVTDAGHRFLADAREVLRHVEQAAANARQAGRGELGSLTIGITTSASSVDPLTMWIIGFLQANPAIDYSARRLVPMDQIAGIMRKELDAGFTRTPHKYPAGVQGFEIYRQPLILALPSKHPLARRKGIAPAMLKDEAFVNSNPERDVGFWGHTETVARIGNFTPRVVKRDDDLLTVLHYVALGFGVAVLPKLTTRVDVSNVVFREIATNPVLVTSIAFVYHRDASPAANLLIKHMRRYALPQRKIDSRPHNRIASSQTMEKDDELIAPPPISAPSRGGSGIAHDGAFGES